MRNGEGRKFLAFVSVSNRDRVGAHTKVIKVLGINSIAPAYAVSGRSSGNGQVDRTVIVAKAGYIGRYAGKSNKRWFGYDIALNQRTLICIRSRDGIVACRQVVDSAGSRAVAPGVGVSADAASNRQYDASKSISLAGSISDGFLDIKGSGSINLNGNIVRTAIGIRDGYAIGADREVGAVFSVDAVVPEVAISWGSARNGHCNRSVIISVTHNVTWRSADVGRRRSTDLNVT